MDTSIKDNKQAKMNDSNPSPQEELDSEVSSEQKTETQASKKRKLVHKTVVKVKIGENVGKLKNEGPPSDRWSWRKYGQKPIKGSPHPRGYYKCSTSKGCSAKKQVERCRTDASVLFITYTSSHNHPDPDLDRPSATNRTIVFKESLTQTTNNLPPQTNMDDRGQEHGEKHCHKPNEGDSSPGDFHYLQSPIRHPQENVMIDQYEDPFTNLDTTQETISLIIQEEPPSCFQLMNISTTKTDEYDFFDELEELPTYSSFSNFMASYLSPERIQVAPS